MSNFNLKAILSANIEPFKKKLDEAKHVSKSKLGEIQGNLKNLGGVAGKMGGVVGQLSGNI